MSKYKDALKLLLVMDDLTWVDADQESLEGFPTLAAQVVSVMFGVDAKIVRRDLIRLRHQQAAKYGE